MRAGARHGVPLAAMNPPHGGIGLPQLLVIFVVLLVCYGVTRLRPR